MREHKEEREIPKIISQWCHDIRRILCQQKDEKDNLWALLQIKPGNNFNTVHTRVHMTWN